MTSRDNPKIIPFKAYHLTEVGLTEGDSKIQFYCGKVYESSGIAFSALTKEGIIASAGVFIYEGRPVAWFASGEKGRPYIHWIHRQVRRFLREVKMLYPKIYVTVDPMKARFAESFGPDLLEVN